ncbi:MAG TPA: NUDIX hydrolase [Nitrosospira sp.]|jgi:ADP-ribose pyrophosphatase YjhB (NUDIX family)|nr:NUDIX hydrolase [Nitrosospira sp.]
MKYCSDCGKLVELRIPEGDTLPRHVCSACHVIHYQNPKIVVGCIPEWEDRILLCLRAIEPRHGFWTLPAGFMENAETLAQGAERETLEEANARVEMGELYSIYDVPYINQVHVLFRARLLDLDFKPGIESLDVKLFNEAEIPWDTLAFRVIREPLNRYFEERRSGKLGFHMGTIEEARK